MENNGGSSTRELDVDMGSQKKTKEPKEVEEINEFQWHGTMRRDVKYRFDE